ncbi:MAG: PilZ domain-containing protein [Pyrinomonadaceae bacterium]
MPRKSDRVEFLRETALESTTGKRDVRISDLSAGGCYIDTIATLLEGTIVWLEIQSPDGDPVRFTGKVAHESPGMGIGIEFTEMTQAQHDFLASILAPSK